MNSLASVFAAINRLQDFGLVASYAIGGATAVLFYAEPTRTYDHDVFRQLDPHTVEGIAKKNGRVCVRETAVLSQDGHVIRVTYLIYDERGNTHTSHGVFERIGSP